MLASLVRSSTARLATPSGKPLKKTVGRLDECLKSVEDFCATTGDEGQAAVEDDRRRVHGMRRSPLPTRSWSNYFTRGHTAYPNVLPLLLRSSGHTHGVGLDCVSAKRDT
jgi:hypothetical protein